MPISVIKDKTEDFILARKFNGVELRINSAVRVSKYNKKQELLDDEQDLYEDFKNANSEKAVKTAVEKLFSVYGLQRRPAFNPGRIAPILLRNLREIKQEHGVRQGNVQEVKRDFNCWNKAFSGKLGRKKDLPEVTLSKLLHFINPKRFWIIDGRIKSLISIWGFEPSFSGYGDLLEELFRHKLFHQFKAFLQRHDNGRPFLKSLDKILWIRH